MTQFADLEEWETVQKTCGLILSIIHNVVGALPQLHLDNYLDNLSQEIRMINVSVPLGIRLTTTVADECKTRLKSLIQLFKQLPGATNPAAIDTAQIHSAITHIEDANKYFISLGRAAPSLSSSATALAEHNLKPVDDAIQVFTENVLDKLCTLFSECSYQSAHQIMLRLSGLQGLNPMLTTALHLLLSSCEGYAKGTNFWQDATCPHPSTDNTHTLNGQLYMLRDLCRNIHCRLHVSESLRLWLMNGELFYFNNVEDEITPVGSSPNSSLYELLGKGYFLPITWNSTDRLTTWEKRGLALNLGLAFMHLFDCKWTRHKWKATHLHFLDPLTLHYSDSLLQTPSYLGCNMSAAIPPEEDADPFCHGHPDFLLFGKLLAELETGEEVEATEKNKLDAPSLYLTLLVGIHRGKLSAHPHYSKAIRACLSLYKQPHDPDLIREKIQGTIVSNLYKALASCEKPQMPQIKIPSTKAGAQLEVSSAPVSSGHQLYSSATPFLREEIRELPNASLKLPEEMPNTASNARVSNTNTFISQDLNLGSPLRRSKRPKQLVCSKLASNTWKSPLLPIRDHDRISKVRGSRAPSIKLSKRSGTQEYLESIQSTQCSNRVRLFDDSPNCIDSYKQESAKEFLAFYDDFKSKHGQSLASPYKNNARTDKLPEFRISVCIIDTGIDKSHPAIRGALRSDRIQGCRSWVGNEDDVHDNYGHGTHVADMILNASENVDLYIAKVADGPDIEPHGVNKIAEAISYATTVWNVDILTMSFGFLEIELDVKAAIDEASRRGKLLFASASNHGNNQIGRTYPAKHRNVIAISASTGKGKDGQISPSPESNDDNFMTLGIAVPLIWKERRVYKSGTSYATPIAAGFAINALEFVFRVMGQEHFQRLKQSDDFMRCVLRLMSKEDPSGYRFVAPWLLWDGRKTPGLVSQLLHHAMYNT
ncbi:hypothetical protein F4811DRAFT_509771 [Daldinia bambusicola]|nr:hypothetical protein F4811DRAFT_509771 [Daldinia bambusicola]